MAATPDTAPASLLHVARAAELAACAADEDYAPEGFAAEGFIHCCRPQQLAGVLERHFDDHADLVLLELDASALPVAPVEEDTTGRGERFPHLYARIPWSAMRHRRPLATGGEADTIRHGDLAVSGETTAWLRRFLCFGTLTDADLSGCLADSWARPGYAPDRAELYDFRAADPRALTADGIRSLAGLFATLFADAPPRAIAILAPNDLLFGFARMFAVHVGEGGARFEILDRADAARDWLAAIEASAAGSGARQRTDDDHETRRKDPA